MVEPNGQVGTTARALGFAGLLPQIAAVALIVAGHILSGEAVILAFAGYWIALGYGAIILSFLGGMWWGFAMRRQADQGSLVILAVMPSLIAAGVLAYAVNWGPVPRSGWTAVVLGSAILLTLLVDRRLAESGEAPEGWMRLRVPLSVGLGGLTIVAGALL